MDICPICSIRPVPSRAHKFCGDVECRRKRAAELQRAYRAKNPDTARARTRLSMKRLRDRNPDAVSVNKRAWRYGISPAEYLKLLDSQGWRCAICPTDIDHRSAQVDHDHSCCSGRGAACGGCIRGLLCRRCNAVLGMAQDSPAVLYRAIQYLAKSA